MAADGQVQRALQQAWGSHVARHVTGLVSKENDTSSASDKRVSGIRAQAHRRLLREQHAVQLKALCSARLLRLRGQLNRNNAAREHLACPAVLVCALQKRLSQSTVSEDGVLLKDQEDPEGLGLTQEAGFHVAWKKSVASPAHKIAIQFTI